MKTIIGAIALFVAVPAVAQTAPVADHSAHQGMDHSQHQADKHDCKECCEKMKGKMECMDEKGETKTSAPSAQQDHQGQEGHGH